MKKNKALILGALALGTINLSACSTKTEEIKPIEKELETSSIARNEKEPEVETEMEPEVETEMEKEPKVEKETEKEAEIIESELNQDVKYSNADLKIYKTLVKEEENITFSPYSLRNALGIIYNGTNNEVKNMLDSEFGFSRNGAEYYDLYNKSLEFNDGIGVKVANKGFLREKKDTDSVLNMDSLNVSDIEEIDMSDTEKAADIMNKYISDNTEQKIKNLILPSNIQPDTRFVAINALYFNQKWNHDELMINWKDSGYIDGFGNITEDLKMVKEVGDLDVLRLPYDNCNYSMYIICDNDEVEGKHVDEYLNSITMEEYMNLIDFSDYEGLQGYDEINYGVPEFEMDCKLSLNNHLIENGYASLYNENALENIGDVSISDILQGTYIKVTKDGTEAAAATALLVKDNSIAFIDETVTKYVRADDTFHFVIKDDVTNEILFMGRVDSIDNKAE